MPRACERAYELALRAGRRRRDELDAARRLSRRPRAPNCAQTALTAEQLEAEAWQRLRPRAVPAE